MLRVALDYLKTNPKLESRNCPICETDEYTVISMEDRYGLPITHRKCWCGFTYISPVPSEETYSEFYKNWYRKFIKEYKGEEAISGMEDNQKRYGEYVGRFLVESGKLPYDVRGIDVGGSTGAATQSIVQKILLSGRTAEFLVVDPNGEELDHAREKGLNTALGSACDIKLLKTDNLVLLCRTIDHIADPHNAILHIKEQAATGTLMYIDFSEDQTPRIDHPSVWTRERMEVFLSIDMKMSILCSLDVPHSTCFGYLCEVI